VRASGIGDHTYLKCRVLLTFEMPKIKGMERERELKPIYILINSDGAKCSRKEVCGTLKRHKAQAGNRSGLYKPDADPPIGGPRIWSCQMNALCIWNEQDVPPFGQLIATETATAVRCLSACACASASMVHLSNPGRKRKCAAHSKGIRHKQAIEAVYINQMLIRRSVVLAFGAVK